MAGRGGRVSLADRVYESLREDLATGRLAPTERLRAEPLARRYGVSRTPVREALARLQADGLVRRHPEGLYLYRPRLAELDELFELRMVLEARGFQRLTLGSATPGGHDLAAVRAELLRWREFRDTPPRPGPELVAADEQFHTELLRAAGNSALAEELSGVYRRVRPVRTMDVPTTDRVATMTAEHITIAEHVLAGRRESALRALVTHIASSCVHVRARAEQAIAFTKLGGTVLD
ncbi:GntR family transcriptional regulator [Nocardia caishijiensis]|uniref:GntR family transcriptional regulator n=1 Tax=Nocardia caishijiensis TaxID=184756 RepID=A0ABQ6YT95_9NOCA|nr:GntR family transcriptional regulator [Nocardia caishijiensis]KAF0849038.1 GntR family transcriptional regulator [Nocardia caishijiensis]